MAPIRKFAMSPVPGSVPQRFEAVPPVGVLVGVRVGAHRDDGDTVTLSNLRAANSCSLLLHEDPMPADFYASEAAGATALRDYPTIRGNTVVSVECTDPEAEVFALVETVVRPERSTDALD